jgi:hypothetical protein
MLDEVRSALVFEICIPLLSHAQLSIDAIAELFENRMGVLLDVRHSYISVFQSLLQIFIWFFPHTSQYLRDGRAPRSGDIEERHTALMEQRCSFALIDAFYRRLPAQVIRERINRFYSERYQKHADGKASNLTAYVLKLGYDAVRAAKVTQIQIQKNIDFFCWCSCNDALGRRWTI